MLGRSVNIDGSEPDRGTGSGHSDMYALASMDYAPDMPESSAPTFVVII
jgi:hypothetical protein